mgnify:FL=1
MSEQPVLRTENGFRHQWLEAFLFLAQKVKVPSKELEKPGPIVLYDAQMRFLHEVDEGLAQGQHFFTVLKSRQLGISTIMLLLDIFWLYLHDGLQGAVIADEEKNTNTFRSTITMMLASMPPGFRIGIEKHNKNELVLKNGSRLQYLTAGKRANPDLGRSRGLNFVHSSETSNYGDAAGVKSLIDALATENPNRLFIFESTAKGPNLFQDMVQDAKNDPLKRAIFIGWWAKSLNRIPRRLIVNGQDAGPHPNFVRFWDVQPVLTQQEEAMAYLIRKDYGVELTDEQWAWWRWQLSERDEQNLLQEHPWHEDVAFQVTGHHFFQAKRLTDDMNRIRTVQVTFDGYRYLVGDHFTSLRCEKAEKLEDVELRIWESPVKGAKYVMGVDVAYGRNANNDRHCIEVFRCYADKMVQVAEWATNMPETRVVAWVLAHLAGSYRDIMINLEVSGPGLEVMTQMKLLRQDIQYAHLRHMEPVFDHRYALDQARWYLYNRPDTPAGGYMYNWKMNSDNKQEVFNGLRDTYNTDQLVIRSPALLEEMGHLIQNGVQIGARPGKKDDRVVSSALSCHAWRHWVRLPMMQDGRTFAVETRKQQIAVEAGGKVVDNIVSTHFKRMAVARQDESLRRLLGGYESS